MSKSNGQAGTVTIEHGTASLCQGIAAALEAGSAVALTKGASDRLHGVGQAFRKTVAGHMNKYGVPEGGATVVVEHGTGALSAVSALMTIPGSKVDSLRDHVNRLHAERGEAVLEAKKAREEQGFKSAAFQLDWQHVEDLTRAIVHYEAQLEKALAEVRDVPAWRDPAVEMPDDDISVIGRFESEDYPVYPTLHDEHGWGPADGCGGTYTDKLTGWMHIHEAAEILDAARKAVRS